MGETVRRAMTIGEDAIASFRPSDFWKKYIRRNSLLLEAAANWQLHTTTSQIHSEAVGEVRERMCYCRGRQGGAAFDHSGASSWGGG
jgi:hypothetical protein